MKVLALSLLIFVMSLPSFALIHLRTGDIILQPLDCKLCSVIELEEGGPYSHIGLVIVDKEKNVFVVEAYGKVQATPIDEFLDKTEKGQASAVMRNIELEVMYRNWPERFNKFRTELIEKFLKVEGAEYDSEFLWDNKSEDGREKYYCSELVTKLLNPFLENQILPKKMHFDRPEWTEYFKGVLPVGQPGISPMDFVKNIHFIDIFEFNPNNNLNVIPIGQKW